jgi:biopolymer transport protein ExbB
MPNFGFDLVEKFQQGGGFMWPILFLFVIGLVVSLERFFSLSFATVNTKKFLEKVINELQSNGVESAKELCRKTRGPVASIFQAGLERYKDSVAQAQHAIEEAGTIEMSLLEKRLIWLATVINVAPMLGFCGTVWGMIQAFDAIAAAGEVEPTIVASGISVALLTTLGGLVVAIPYQLTYNFFLNKVNSLVIDMQESAAALVNVLDEGIAG